MDPKRFEVLTRSLSAATSRRRTAKTVIGGAVGSLVAGLRGERSWGVQEGEAADCLKKGEVCGSGNKPSCSKCCTGCSKLDNGKRRCSCCRDGKPCVKFTDCCSKTCVEGICGRCALYC